MAAECHYGLLCKLVANVTLKRGRFVEFCWSILPHELGHLACQRLVVPIDFGVRRWHGLLMYRDVHHAAGGLRAARDATSVLGVCKQTRSTACTLHGGAEQISSLIVRYGMDLQQRNQSFDCFCSDYKERVYALPFFFCIFFK